MTADSNDRVLECVPPFSTGMPASLELGFPPAVGMNSPTPLQGSICTAPTAANFCGLSAVAFDSKGDLWISDSGNNRILEFSPPFSSGMAASLVIGQPDFTSGSLEATTANTLDDPNGLTFDAAGDLIVADWLNNRVLIFVPPFSNGMGASAVLGQPDMTTATPHGCGDWTTGPPQFGEPSASTFCDPQGVLAF